MIYWVVFALGVLDILRLSNRRGSPSHHKIKYYCQTEPGALPCLGECFSKMAKATDEP